MRKTILITGASSGLGEEMARQFAALGHDLALAARRTDRLETLKAEIAERHPGVRVEMRALDVNDHDQVFEVFRAFRGDFGRLDRVVVNAGVGKGVRLGTGGFDANRETAMTNFVAALAQVEAALEIFRDQDAGHLVVISSMSAMRGMPKAGTTYAATKAAVAHLAEGVRADVMGYADQGVGHLPGVHPLGDEREGQGRAVHRLHRGRRRRDGRGHREGEALRPCAGLAVGPGRLRPASPPAPARPPADGLRRPPTMTP